MTGEWEFSAPVGGRNRSGPTLTLVEGDSFCISDGAGDIHPGTPHGLFDRDTRFISCWELLVDEAPIEHLAVLPTTPFSAEIIGRAVPRGGRADSTLAVFRNRYVGRGMREDIVIRNSALEPAALTLTLNVDADFAHIFEVKEERVTKRGETVTEASDARLTYRFDWQGLRRGVTVSVSDPEATAVDGSITMHPVVPARDEWRLCVQVTPIMDDGAVEPHYRCGQPVETAAPLHRLLEWQLSAPSVESEHPGLNRATAVGKADLGALRIFDPDHPDRAVVAAGAPWFMTLFGRDSLITSWMALLVDPALAVGTLRTLAAYQGSKHDPISEEEPGRIPHELRWGLSRPLARGAGGLYYGSADATPLFVMLMGELRRWGLEQAVVDELLPHADRALAWMTEHGDRDGDGFVEYRRATDRGLVNQGWKDSWDGISFASGRLAEAPIALCEVQGYTYAAYVARAHFAREGGDPELAQHWAQAAARLKARFNEDFWMPDHGFFAVGLDADKTPIDSITSNVGHCLWTGIVDEDKAAAVAERLLSPEMFSGFGVRTLAADMGAFNPVSYHNGSIWPHDNALVAAGLMRYGFVGEAQRVILGLLNAAESFDGRLPELFCGFDRAEFEVPIGYPTACSPQAWAAAAPLSMIRPLLRLDPWIPRLALWLAPAVPEEVGRLSVGNVPLAGNRISIEATPDGAVVDGLPRDVTVVSQARHPLHEAFREP